MSQKAIREYHGKSMLSKWLSKHTDILFDGFAPVLPSTDLEELPNEYPWLLTDRLVAKPDQLIKRRGKAGLIKLNATFDQAVSWINERRNKEIQVESVKGVLDHFLIERFTPHNQVDEFYVCIHTKRDGDEILFYHEGGVDVGDVDSKANRCLIPIGQELSASAIEDLTNQVANQTKRQTLNKFISALYRFFTELNYSYLEINPIVVTDDLRVVPLDMAAKIDETAKFECGTLWGKIDFPPPFGRPPRPEEAYIQELDGKTGASLKLTILNPAGRIWTMVAGGGASVIYADTLCDLGAGHELANYGEYSGAPDENSTFCYAKTILDLMLREKDPRGKILLIGGGIANFTNVAATFKGIISAIRLYADQIRAHNVKIYVRRAGPNYQEGLDMMRTLAKQLNLFIEVFGPEVHMTSIVALALGLPVKESVPEFPSNETRNMLSRASISSPPPAAAKPREWPQAKPEEQSTSAPVSTETMKSESESGENPSYQLFTNKTRAIIVGMQTQAVQNMLDFDYICGRSTPSVAAIVYPFEANHYTKFYWSTKEILVPSYSSFAEAISKFPDVDVVINFSSFRSVYESTKEILDCSQIRTVAIIAEGVPERRTRELIKSAKSKGVTIIGPATVGGIKPGCFRIGNTGGMLDNIVSSKLYRPGSVAYVARSGGMSNELNNIIARNSDGVYEGIAIGGDRYPGTTFIDHLLRYQANPDVKMTIVLGEVGGVEEYEICRLIKEKVLTKPIIAWAIGTCAKIFPYEVQFGHAGACAHGQVETADAKNLALKEVGAYVPQSFEDFGVVINHVYNDLVNNGVIQVKEELPPPVIPVDYEWARKLGLIRKPSSFISSIVDERGDELVYAGVKISEVFKHNLGIGGVVGLIWFRKLLPDYFCRFIELVLQITADHGPAVAGAHNTIVCARAGKDLISSLVSGLLTIGPRFGGALDDAARKFVWAFDSNMSPEDFVNYMRKSKELIPGIGHKVKSLENPDVRVVIVKDFVFKNFKSHQLLDYALECEKLTTKKKSNLILNVDGCIAVAFVDLMRSCGAFETNEINDYINMGILNGLFVLGRSIGFIGHFIDQNRLKQSLYRHPTEDISYLTSANLSL